MVNYEPWQRVEKNEKDAKEDFQDVIKRTVRSVLKKRDTERIETKAAIGIIQKVSQPQTRHADSCTSTS